MYVFKITNERTNGRLFCVCVFVCGGCDGGARNRFPKSYTGSYWKVNRTVRGILFPFFLTAGRLGSMIRNGSKRNWCQNITNNRDWVAFNDNWICTALRGLCRVPIVAAIIMNCSYKVDNRSRRICDESGSRKVSGSIDENHNHPGNTNDRPIFTRCDPVCNEHTHTDRSRPTDRPTQEKHTQTGDQKEAQGTRIYPQDRY